MLQKGFTTVDRIIESFSMKLKNCRVYLSKGSLCRLIISAIFLLLIMCLAKADVTTQTRWISLTKGIDYATISPNPAFPLQKIHAFRIDLLKYRLSLIVAKNYHQPSFFVTQAGSLINALIAINGGFFSPDFQSLGLRVNKGDILSTTKNTNWWGIFVIKKNRATIVSKSNFHYSKEIQLAVQAGPRLVINGRIPPLRGNLAERSALGITKEGKVIITVTQNIALGITQLANIMSASEKNGGLGCYNVLNLDGGSSSQLYAHIGNFTLQIPSIRPVADMIV